MPFFALSSAGVALELSNLTDSVAVAVIVGLVIGKPLGIISLSWLAVRLGWAKLSDDVGWPLLASGRFLAGILRGNQRCRSPHALPANVLR